MPTLSSTPQKQFAFKHPSPKFVSVTPLQQLEKRVSGLTEKQRAALAGRLLASLPPVLADADDGVSEARRRDSELDADPRSGVSEKTFHSSIAASRR
jgi:hypothetical protein